MGKNRINNDKERIIMDGDEAIGIVQIKIGIINNEGMIPILGGRSNFLG
ncbi:hypothetical protein [Staphylococcus epidermidis]|nr:hypothetical protein [Staphylococcus epidermidis]